MANVSLLNTTANLSGKTVAVVENTQTITGAWTYDRDPSAPFAVTAGSAVVANLDSDKLDGLEATAFIREASAGTKSAGDLTFNDNIIATFGTGGDADLYYDGTDLILNTQVVGTGVLSLSAGQLKFPAAQNASTNVNTLDDYEEGSWTPTITGSGGASGQAYGVQVGKYVKVGKLVTVHGNVQLSTLGTITTDVQIGGLPFTSENTANLDSGVTITNFSALTSSFVYLVGRIQPNTTVITLRGLTAAATGLSSLVQADLAATSRFSFMGSYTATA